MNSSKTWSFLAAAFLVWVVLVWGAQSARGAGIRDVQNGMRAEEVVELLGEPTGRMTMGAQAILRYPYGEVELRDGVVIGLKLKKEGASSKESLTVEPGTLAAAAPEVPNRDLRSIMARLRVGKGLDCAEAVRSCDGPWAADAIPLLIPLLASEEPFGIYTTTYIGGRPAGGARPPTPTDMRSLAGSALARIGVAAWEPCMRVLRTGSPLERAVAASVLSALQAKHAANGSDFPALLLTVFESHILDGAAAAQARREMARTVASQPGPEALEALHRMLGDPRNLPIEHTISLLGGRKDPTTLPLLVEILLQNHNESARKAAGVVLLRWGEEADVASAVRSGVDHPDPGVRRHVMQIFQASGKSALSDDYMRFFQDGDRSIRRHAVQGATPFSTPEVMLALTNILHHERDETIAQDAGGSLVLMTQDVHDARVVEALCKGVRHPNADRRARFTDALGRTGAPAGYDALADVARHDAEPRVRALALERLDNFQNDKTAGILLRALKEDAAPEARQAAMQRIKYGSLRHQKQSILLELVQTGASEQAREAAFVMGEFDIVNRHPDVLEVLIQSLRHHDEQVRSRAAYYLCAEADIPQFSSEGRALGEDPAKWRERFRAP